MDAIDCHAHFVSATVVKALKEPEASDRYGVSLLQEPAGRFRFRVGSDNPTFPPPATLFDLANRRSSLDRDGVRVQIVGPWAEISGYSASAEQGAAWCRLLNDTMAEDIRSVLGSVRFMGLAALPLQDGRLAALEFERCLATREFAGAMIGTNVNGEPLDNRSLDPVWEVAQASGVPLVLHPGHVAGIDRMPRYWLPTLVGYPFETTIAAASLVFGGTLDRFPDLDVLLVHGGGMLPYQVGRLERGHSVRPEAQANGAGAPRDYLRRFWYDTLLFSGPALRYLVETVGSDRVVLGSDAPFDLGDPNPVRIVAESGLGEPIIHDILVRNATRLIGPDREPRGSTVPHGSGRA